MENTKPNIQAARAALAARMAGGKKGSKKLSEAQKVANREALERKINIKAANTSKNKQVATQWTSKAECGFSH
jgi:hypothetical protein